MGAGLSQSQEQSLPPTKASSDEKWGPVVLKLLVGNLQVACGFILEILVSPKPSLFGSYIESFRNLLKRLMRAYLNCDMHRRLFGLIWPHPANFICFWISLVAALVATSA